MGGKRKPSRHQVSEIKRATSAIEMTTGRPVIGAQFFPDGSFLLTVGLEAADPKNPNANADEALKEWQKKHADKTEGTALGEGEAR
jgi:hypothetical protein